MIIALTMMLAIEKKIQPQRKMPVALAVVLSVVPAVTICAKLKKSLKPKSLVAFMFSKPAAGMIARMLGLDGKLLVSRVEKTMPDETR